MGSGLPLKAGQDEGGEDGHGDGEVRVIEEEADLRREDLLFCGIPVVGRCLGEWGTGGHDWDTEIPVS